MFSKSHGLQAQRQPVAKLVPYTPPTHSARLGYPIAVARDGARLPRCGFPPISSFVHFRERVERLSRNWDSVPPAFCASVERHFLSLLVPSFAALAGDGNMSSR